jgi:hypothetical protein
MNMRTLAKKNGWAILQDMNGVVSIEKDNAAYFVDSAVEGLRHIPDLETRYELAKQLFRGAK